MQTKLRNSENKSLTNRSPSSYDSSEREAHKISESFKHSSDVKGEMSNKLGIDFSSVRVHSGAGAAQKAQGMGKAAFAQGSDVYMGSSNALSSAGVTQSQALAHELTHTVQQGAATQTGGAISQSAPMGSVQGLDIFDRFKYWAGGGGKKADSKKKEWLATGKVGSWRNKKALRLAGKENEAGVSAFQSQQAAENTENLQTHVEAGQISGDVAGALSGGASGAAHAEVIQSQLAAFKFFKDKYGMSDEDYAWISSLLVSTMNTAAKDQLLLTATQDMQQKNATSGYGPAYAQLMDGQNAFDRDYAAGEQANSEQDYNNVQNEISQYLLQKYGASTDRIIEAYHNSEEFQQDEGDKSDRLEAYYAKKDAEAAAQARAAMTPAQLQQEADEQKANLAMDASDAFITARMGSPDYEKYGFGATYDDIAAVHEYFARRMPSFMELLDTQSRVNLAVLYIGRARQKKEEPQIFEREKEQIYDATMPFIWQAFKNLYNTLDTSLIMQTLDALVSGDNATVVANFPQINKLGATLGNFADIFSHEPRVKAGYPNQNEIEETRSITRLGMLVNGTSNIRIEMMMNVKENPDIQAVLRHLESRKTGEGPEVAKQAEWVRERVERRGQGEVGNSAYDGMDINAHGFIDSMKDPEIMARAKSGQYTRHDADVKTAEYRGKFEKDRDDKRAAAEAAQAAAQAPKKKKRWFF